MDRLKAANCSFIYYDIDSGRSDGRANYRKLLKECEKFGSNLTIIVTRLDRLTRSLPELMRFIK